MIYTDSIHLIADSITELHEFASKIELKRCYFHGVRKKHPHYDLTNKIIKDKAIENGAILISSKEIVKHFKKHLL
jgi:hypothetical protein